MEHTFLSSWQRAYRALKQRNAALRANSPKEQIKLWDTELISAALELNPARKKYIESFEPIFEDIFKTFLEDIDISLTYYQGWSREQDLDEVLDASLERDLQLGYSQYGPHRADISFKVSNTPAQDRLSQGQQKLVVYAARLAQGTLFHQQTGKRCLYVIDDLPAELDQQKQERVAAHLIKLDTQVFVTGIEKGDLIRLFPTEETELFHVEQGVVSSGVL